MVLANNALTACFTMLRIIIIRVCVKVIVMARFINKEKLCLGKFSWQEGYGAFSYSRSQIEDVYNYIQNQEQHHRKQTFKQEYLDFLKKFEVEYNPDFLFHFWDE